jgi:hypothetical protein
VTFFLEVSYIIKLIAADKAIRSLVVPEEQLNIFINNSIANPQDDRKNTAIPKKESMATGTL